MLIPFTQVDAFADAPFTGNPAAVMPLERWLDDAVLQAIAAENNLSETAFTVPVRGDAEADFDLRWFTPTVEVALCGHATLASGHVLLGARDVVRFRTREAGLLTVSRRGARYALSLPAWPVTPRALPELAAGLGAPPRETHWREGSAVFVYSSPDEVRALRPDFARLKMHGDLLLVATAQATEGSDIVSRVFVPGGGIDEDPVTGSAHCILTPFWAERLGKTQLVAVQASARGGRLECELLGERVVLTGGCRTVIRGEFELG